MVVLAVIVAVVIVVVVVVVVEVVVVTVVEAVVVVVEVVSVFVYKPHAESTGSEVRQRAYNRALNYHLKRMQLKASDIAPANYRAVPASGSHPQSLYGSEYSPTLGEQRLEALKRLVAFSAWAS